MQTFPSDKVISQKSHLFSLQGPCSHVRKSGVIAFMDRAILAHSKLKDRQVQGMQKTSLGLLAGGQKLQANPGEAAFSLLCSWQQGTPRNLRSRRGSRTWRKTNLHLLPPPGKTNERRKTLKMSCVAATALTEISATPRFLFQECFLQDLPLYHQTRVTILIPFIALSLQRAEYYPK